MAATKLKKLPVMTRSAGVADALSRMVQTVKGPTLYGSDAGGTIDLFRVPANTLVVDIRLHRKTAFDGALASEAITIGDSDDADRFIDAAAANDVGGSDAAWVSMLQDSSQPGAGGHLYSDDAVIQATVNAFDSDTNARTTGEVVPYLFYLADANKLVD